MSSLIQVNKLTGGRCMVGEITIPETQVTLNSRELHRLMGLVAELMEDISGETLTYPSDDWYTEEDLPELARLYEKISNAVSICRL